LLLGLLLEDNDDDDLEDEDDEDRNVVEYEEDLDGMEDFELNVIGWFAGEAVRDVFWYECGGVTFEA
jgi:hypothetical protein